MTDGQKIQELDDDTLIELMQTVFDTGGIFPLIVTGNSMIPTLRNGRDKVFLMSPKSRQVCVGDIVFAWCDKEKYVLHRIVKRLNEERFVLRGDGNMETEIIREKDIVATAERICRKGRHVSCASWRYRCYVWIWMRVWPFRPWIFQIHRIWYKRIKKGS